MARIAEDVLLLLLGNPEEQPRLERGPLGRVLAAALILDLALDCRVRPTLPSEPLPAGRLVALAGPVPLDPSVRPTLAVLEQRPITAAAAVGALRKHALDTVLDQLLRTGQIHQVQLSSHKLRRNHYRWPVKNRGRAAVLRSEVIGALFERRTPPPVNAAVICLLNAVSALQAVLELNDAGARVVDERSREIAVGDWADESATAEVNLALTLAEVLPAVRARHY
jgi:hypothetical protein